MQLGYVVRYMQISFNEIRFYRSKYIYAITTSTDTYRLCHGKSISTATFNMSIIIYYCSQINWLRSVTTPRTQWNGTRLSKSEQSPSRNYNFTINWYAKLKITCPESGQKWNHQIIIIIIQRIESIIFILAKQMDTFVPMPMPISEHSTVNVTPRFTFTTFTATTFLLIFNGNNISLLSLIAWAAVVDWIVPRFVECDALFRVSQCIKDFWQSLS